MKEVYYGSEKHTPFIFPFGGIGTGVTGFSAYGEICRFDFGSSCCFDSAFCSFSAEVYKGNGLLSGKLLQSAKDGEETENKFTSSGVYVKFPFVKKVYEKSGFVGRITETVFTPFIPHNETDSGIPCAFFEFEIENTSEDTLKYTVTGSCGGFFKGCENTVGCTDSGALYISSRNKGVGVYEGNVCLSTDAKSFSYNMENTNGEFSISGSLSLEPHEKKTVRFVLTWYFPMRENIICPETRFSFETDEEYFVRNIVRNYYAQYFESDIECANYCFEHYERLLCDTKMFSDTLYSSTLPDSIIRTFTEALFSFRSSRVLRLCDGDLYVRGSNVDSSRLNTLENAFALQYMYPLIDRKSAESVINSFELYKGASDIVPVLRALSSFLLTGDFEWLVENWFAIERFVDAILGEDNNVNGLMYAYGLKVCEYLSSVVKDREREEKCREKLSGIPSVFGETDVFYALAHSDVTGISGNFEVSQDAVSVCEKDCPISVAETFIKRGMQKEANLVLQNRGKAKDIAEALSAYSLITAACGLEYNAYEKYIRINPEMAFADNSGTFRCFFSLGTCYGYVERGMDYAEINLLYGKLTVRSFGVPTRPLMVLYGGRKWKFTDTGLCARLDSDLVLTPEKKLTVIIDVSKKQA